ncbi:MAG: DUF5753 domain-containing protein, partial [Stackebrandtia sp.]
LGLNMTEAAQTVDRTQSWLSKMEGGDVSLSAASVRLLLMGYDRPKDEVEEWAALARQANERGWWETEEYKSVVLDDFSEYLSVEAAVTRMSFFDIQLLPGVVQTSDYAKALMKAHLPSERQGEIEDLVALRLARHERLFADDDGPHVRVVLDDPAVHRPIGGSKVMREQLSWLLELGKRRNVDLRVLPLSAGAEAAVGTPFVYLEFHGDPDFVFHECMTSSYYVRDPADVQRHRITFERLQRAALNQKASVSLIQKVMEDLQ